MNKYQSLQPLNNDGAKVEIGALYQDIIATEQKQFKALLKSNQLHAAKQLQTIISKNSMKK